MCGRLNEWRAVSDLSSFMNTSNAAICFVVSSALAAIKRRTGSCKPPVAELSYYLFIDSSGCWQSHLNSIVTVWLVWAGSLMLGAPVAIRLVAAVAYLRYSSVKPARTHLPREFQNDS